MTTPLTPSIEEMEPRGCPTPGACSCIAALREKDRELEDWRDVFGHLGSPDEAGNSINRKLDEKDREIEGLREDLEDLRSGVDTIQRIQTDGVKDLLTYTQMKARRHDPKEKP